MLLSFISKVSAAISQQKNQVVALFSVTTFAALAIALTGCQTHKMDQSEILNSTNGMSHMAKSMTNQTNHAESIVLREGDVVKITFPGAANLNGSHPIGRDGNITLELVGELKAAGKTPAELKADVLKAYADKIESKEANVELVSSSFPVFVTGAVMRPGKVMTDHPMTALEAVMESGGFDYTKANLKSVTILRQNGDQLKSIMLDMKKVMQGKKAEQFYLKPLDIIYVREKFSWF